MCDLADSACAQCAYFTSEGKHYKATLESPEEWPEFYCEIGCDDNFGTPGGCWNHKKKPNYFADYEDD